MKAIILDRYGSTDYLIFTDYPKPDVVDDDTVIIKILYTSINSADLDFIHGHPLVRFTGLFKPRYPILGSDCVGIIETVGSKVKGVNIGDIIWADLSYPSQYGTFAEYVSVSSHVLQLIPTDIDLKDAACLPTAAIVALQNVNLKKKPKKGDKVLVNGAGGGIGTILVQFLNSIGCEVTAVDLEEKHKMLIDIGASRTINYLKTDYTNEKIKYDYVYDLVCSKKLSKRLSTVKKNGCFIMLGGSTKNILSILIFGPLISLLWSRRVFLGNWRPNNHNDLLTLAKLYKEGVIKPVIDRTIQLDETIEGLKDLEKGGVLGKIVIKVN